MQRVVIEFKNKSKVEYLTEIVREGTNAFHLDVQGCDVCIPFNFVRGGTVQDLNNVSVA